MDTGRSSTEVHAVEPALLQARSGPRSAWALLIPLLALPALWPLFANGLPRASDSALHLARLALLHEHILAGTLWPRWLPELTLGYGYLFFSYYAPATYYVAEMLQLVGFSSYHALQILSAALVVGAGMTMFFFARTQFARRGPPALTLAAALVAAVAAVYNPYLLTNIYLRGAYGEAGAQLLLPLILLGVHQVFYEPTPPRAPILLAFSLAALALTHTVSLLFAPVVIVGYTLVLWVMGGRDRARLACAGMGFALAMALSAAFWLPLLLQRDLVTNLGTELARSVRLPASMWTWGNFLDSGLSYAYSFVRPVRLGLIQLLLGIAGFVLARRRDGEWLFLGIVALLSALLIGAWALPLWQNSPLVVAQLAWRLLSIVTLPLALFVGGVVLVTPGRPRSAVLLGGALVALIIVAQRPRIDWLDVFAPTALPDRASIAQLEVLKGVASGGERNSNVQEFRPRGAPAVLALLEQPPAPALEPTLTVLAGDGFSTILNIWAPASFTLRLTDFYHPNWHVTMDDAISPHPAYASTSLSLLSIDVPAGGHLLSVRWVPSAAEWVGAAASLAASIGLAGWALLRRKRGLAFAAGALLMFVAASLYTPPAAAVTSPEAAVEAHGLRLAGLRVEAGQPQHALLRAWWQVVAPPPTGLRIRWIVRDGESGTIVGDSTGAPWLNASGAQQWPAGALVDDAYALPLPAGLAAGSYDLALEVLGPGDVASAAPEALAAVAHFALPGPVAPDPVPQHAFAANVGEAIQLVGYDLEGADTKEGAAAPVVRAGSRLALTLYWRTDRVLPANLRTFAHLFDSLGRGLVKEDQTPGPDFHATASWLPGRVYTDRYLLQIPAQAPGGLYSPWVGMVDEAGEHLPVTVFGAAGAGEARLPPVKVLQRTAPRPTEPSGARFGDLARLTGYDLATPDTLRAGDAFAVTLHFEALSSTRADYIRFLQLLDATGNVIAQHDGPPAQINPTSSWLPRERLLDTVPLVVGPGAQPGTATLIVGFYAEGAPESRLPAVDAGGEPLPNRAVELRALTIGP